MSKQMSYQSLHDWVRKQLGTPSLCVMCKTTTGTFDWSNISHEYKADINDWQRLCRKCHHAFDKKSDTWKATVLKKYGRACPRLPIVDLEKVMADPIWIRRHNGLSYHSWRLSVDSGSSAKDLQQQFNIGKQRVLEYLRIDYEEQHDQQK